MVCNSRRPTPTANRALCTGVKLTQRRILEIVRIKPETAAGLRIQLLERRHPLRGLRTEKENAGDQLVVVLGVEADWKPALELRDPRNCPVVQQFALKAFVLGDGKLPGVADDETLRRVEQRKSSARLGIKRVECFLKS